MLCHVDTFTKSTQKTSLHDHVETLLVCVTIKACLEAPFAVVYAASALAWATMFKRYKYFFLR
jgi:hypothetical protein